MIARALFLKGIAAAATIGTGGLDVWDPLSPQIRVLIGDLGGGAWEAFSDGTFGFAGKRWRGAPSTVRLNDGRMVLVTSIDVDAYLQGVVPLESPASWPLAALEAQAIVARTFALARRTLSRPYDVSATEADQRWGGVDAEAASTTAAIAATRGKILSFAGGLAQVFYSACCGGHTADVTAAWNGGTPLSYLRGVVDPYCAGAPDYRWAREVPLARALAAFGARTGGSLTAAELIDPDPTGRPREVSLTGSGSAIVPVAEFRRGLGSDVVRSSWLRTVRVESQSSGRLVLEGAGRGHGVGLCQWGARGFAAAGASAAQILDLYFPGTALTGG